MPFQHFRVFQRNVLHVHVIEYMYSVIMNLKSEIYICLYMYMPTKFTCIPTAHIHVHVSKYMYFVINSISHVYMYFYMLHSIINYNEIISNTITIMDN